MGTQAIMLCNYRSAKQKRRLKFENTRLSVWRRCVGLNLARTRRGVVAVSVSPSVAGIHQQRTTGGHGKGKGRFTFTDHCSVIGPFRVIHRSFFGSIRNGVSPCLPDHGECQSYGCIRTSPSFFPFECNKTPWLNGERITHR